MSEVKKNNEINHNEINEDSSGIKMVILRLLSDVDFKEELIEDADKALEGYELNEVQKILIKSLSPEDIEGLTPENIEEYFSADAAVYTPDESVDLDEYDTFEDNDLFDED